MKIFKRITKTLVVFVIALSVFIFSFYVTGFKLMYVVSESMEPTFYRGSLIIVKNLDEQILPLNEGMVIVFKAPWYNDEIVTHRIIDINGDNITTQGDNNNIADPVGKLENVEGVVVQSFKWVGFLFSPWVLRTLVFLTVFLSIMERFLSYAKERRYVGKHSYKIMSKESKK